MTIYVLHATHPLWGSYVYRVYRTRSAAEQRRRYLIGEGWIYGQGWRVTKRTVVDKPTRTNDVGMPPRVRIRECRTRRTRSTSARSR